MSNILTLAAISLATFIGAIAVAYYRYYRPRRKRVNLSYLHAQFLKPMIEKAKPFRRA